jgi:WD40 repeat protein
VNSEIITEKIVAYAYLNDVIIEDFMQVEFQRVLKGHLNPVGVLCLSSKKNFLISTSSGGKKNLIVWDLQEFSIRNELIGHEYSVLCVDISKDDLIAVSGDKSGQLMLWDLQDYSLLRVFKGHSGQILTIKISGNKKYAVSAGFDKIVYIWNILSNCLHAKLIGHLEIIWKVSFTLDNLFVVSADNYHGIHVWNIENKTSVLQINSLNEANLWLERNKEIKADFIKYLS